MYGQVYWTVMDAVALPDDIVKRFDNKTMVSISPFSFSFFLLSFFLLSFFFFFFFSPFLFKYINLQAILGYESDQVMKSEGGAPDVHVPITAAYNHHYGATLVRGGT